MSFVAPPNPADIAYTIFDSMITLDMQENPYVQDPACNYPWYGDFTWSGVPGDLSPPQPYISVDSTDSGKVNILSYNPAEAGSVTISITSVTLHIDDNNGNSFSVVDSTVITTNIVLTDPCTSTYFRPIADLASSLTVTDGDWTEAFFTVPDV